MPPLDQFYTRTDLAAGFAQDVMHRWPDPEVLFIEPSAGTGAFVRPLLDANRKIWAIDIDPKASQIAQMDFLASNAFPSDIRANKHSSIITLGNPPFGKNASLAVRFFNQAAHVSDAIAFILPRTFRKASLHKRLDKMFHLTVDADVEDNAFIRFGRPHNVPCTWQIWTKHNTPRPAPETPSVAHLIKYTAPAEADFAMRRVGFYAGRIITQNLKSLSLTTHYFIKAMAEDVIESLKSVDWPQITAQTAGVRSLSKAEIARKLNEIYHT